MLNKPDFADRIRHHLSRIDGIPPLASKAKNGKRQRKRNRIMRYARCEARKDLNVWKSSHGKATREA